MKPTFANTKRKKTINVIPISKELHKCSTDSIKIGKPLKYKRKLLNYYRKNARSYTIKCFIVAEKMLN